MLNLDHRTLSCKLFKERAQNRLNRETCQQTANDEYILLFQNSTQPLHLVLFVESTMPGQDSIFPAIDAAATTSGHNSVYHINTVQSHGQPNTKHKRERVNS
jgi:hypothetical protein